MPTQLETPPSEILKHISDALVLLDLDGRIVFYNDAFASMVGRSGDDLRGASWAQLADSATCARVDLHGLTGTEQEQVHFNIEMPGGDGAARAYCLTAAPFKNESGRTVGVFQNFRSMDKLRDMILGLREVNEAIQRDTANRIERAFLPASIRQLLTPDISTPAVPGSPCAAGTPNGDEADLRRALEANRWNASRTARALGISRTTLWRKMRRFALLPRV